MALFHSAKVMLNSVFDAVVKYDLNRKDDVDLYAVRFVGYSLQNIFKIRVMSFLYKLMYSTSVWKKCRALWSTK